MEKQVEKTMENDMETGIIQGSMAVSVSQNWRSLFGCP